MTDKTEYENQANFRITDDKTADMALKRIAEGSADIERLIKLKNEEIAEINFKFEAARKCLENSVQYYKDKLSEYFSSVEHKVTKTAEKYVLLNGTLKLKRGGVKPRPNDERLLEWLAANGYTDYIKTEQSPRWGELKKILDFSGGAAVVKETGEIVEGIDFEEVPDEFDVEIK